MMKISGQPSSVQVMRDRKQPKNVEFYNYFGDAICTREVKPYTALATAAFEMKQNLFTSKLDLKLRKKLLKCYIWSITLHDAETWTLRKVAQKYLGSFVMWCL